MSGWVHSAHWSRAMGSKSIATQSNLAPGRSLASGSLDQKETEARESGSEPCRTQFKEQAG